MKQEVSESSFTWDDSKRKGKERAIMDSTSRGTTAGTRRRNTIHGTGYCDGTCQPGPSCTLFPRRPDGKVVLPDPRTSGMVIKPEIYSSNARHVLPGNDYRPRPLHYPEGISVPKEPENDLPPARSHCKIENYAQLSSLPEFKAFRMDQNNNQNKNGSRNSRQSAGQQATSSTEGGGSSAGKSGGSSPKTTTNVDAEWQQWKMREIRVVKRRRKQEYIRSGTHDFSIRLWSNYEA